MKRGPKPWTERRATTAFLRIPRVDWAAVTRGAKTEFRAAGRWAPPPNTLNPPIPIVGYTIKPGGEYLSRLLVLEDTWSEPLGAISPESLAHEGFESVRDFRAYWRTYRTSQAYKPLTTIFVYRVRPFLDTDREVLADRIFGHLYGAHL